MLTGLAGALRAVPVFGMVGDGRAPMSPVDVHDVAAGVAASLERPASIGQCIEVVGPETMTLREMVGIVAEACRVSSRAVVPVPPLLMYGPAMLMERFMRMARLPELP